MCLKDVANKIERFDTDLQYRECEKKELLKMIKVLILS